MIFVMKMTLLIIVAGILLHFVLKAYQNIGESDRLKDRLMAKQKIIHEV